MDQTRDRPRGHGRTWRINQRVQRQQETLARANRSAGLGRPRVVRTPSPISFLPPPPPPPPSQHSNIFSPYFVPKVRNPYLQADLDKENTPHFQNSDEEEAARKELIRKVLKKDWGLKKPQVPLSAIPLNLRPDTVVSKYFEKTAARRAEFHRNCGFRGAKRRRQEVVGPIRPSQVQIRIGSQVQRPVDTQSISRSSAQRSIRESSFDHGRFAERSVWEPRSGYGHGATLPPSTWSVRAAQDRDRSPRRDTSHKRHRSRKRDHSHKYRFREYLGDSEETEIEQTSNHKRRAASLEPWIVQPRPERHILGLTQILAIDDSRNTSNVLAQAGRSESPVPPPEEQNEDWRSWLGIPSSTETVDGSQGYPEGPQTSPAISARSRETRLAIQSQPASSGDVQATYELSEAWEAWENSNQSPSDAAMLATPDYAAEKAEAGCFPIGDLVTDSDEPTPAVSLKHADYLMSGALQAGTSRDDTVTSDEEPNTDKEAPESPLLTGWDRFVTPEAELNRQFDEPWSHPPHTVQSPETDYNDLWRFVAEEYGDGPLLPGLPVYEANHAAARPSQAIDSVPNSGYLPLPGLEREVATAEWPSTNQEGFSDKSVSNDGVPTDTGRIVSCGPASTVGLVFDPTPVHSVPNAWVPSNDAGRGANMESRVRTMRMCTVSSEIAADPPSLAVKSARSEVGVTEPGEHFRFAPPKLFVGKRSSQTSSRRPIEAIAPVSLTRPGRGSTRRGRPKKRARDGRADIRALPNYNSDPIEDIQEEDDHPSSIFGALELVGN